MMRRGTIATSALVMGVVIMTGCAGTGGTPSSVALSEAPGFPSDAPIGEPWNDSDWSGEPLAWISADGARVTVITFGSSACPYIGVSVESLDDALIGIGFEQAPSEACTDDLAPHTHVFAVPEGVDVSGTPLEAEITLAASAFGPVEPRIVRVPILAAAATFGDGGSPSAPDESIAREVVRGTPDDIVLTADDLERGVPLAFWGEGRATVRVVTWGSSGCPPVAQTFTAADPGEAELRFGPNPAEFCTADFAPSTHVLDTPSGVDDAATLTLIVTIVDASGASDSYRVPVQD